MAGRAEERTIPLAGSVLAAKTSRGDPWHAPLCLLALHGWLDNAGGFDRLAPRNRCTTATSSRCGPAVIRPFLAPADGGGYHYVDRFDELRGVFDHFGWARADLLGHSLGGTLASLFKRHCMSSASALLLLVRRSVR